MPVREGIAMAVALYSPVFLTGSDPIFYSSTKTTGTMRTLILFLLFFSFTAHRLAGTIESDKRHSDRLKRNAHIGRYHQN